MITEQHLRRGFRIGGDAAAFQRRDRLRENERRHFIGADFQVIDSLVIERERFDRPRFSRIAKQETQADQQERQGRHAVGKVSSAQEADEDQHAGRRRRGGIGLRHHLDVSAEPESPPSPESRTLSKPGWKAFAVSGNKRELELQVLADDRSRIRRGERERKILKRSIGDGTVRHRLRRKRNSVGQEAQGNVAGLGVQAGAIAIPIATVS